MTDVEKRGLSRVRSGPDEIDELFGWAHPNPQRIGCPPLAALEARARGPGSLDDPIYEHIRLCSECYLEIRQMQDAFARATPSVARARWPSRSRWTWLAAAAAVVLVVMGAWWWAWGNVPPGPTNAGPRVVRELRANLDLRPFAVARSPGGRSVPPLELRSGRVLTDITLPVGADVGRYDVQVLDGDRRSRASATADAVVNDSETRVTVLLDLAALGRGRYELAVRREGETWRVFPVNVR